ncbi:MAG: UPF0158 family protein [Victivallales bacterium]
MIKFDDIENAYEFVNFGSYGEHSAVLRKDTGEILYQSEFGELNEIEAAGEFLDEDNCVDIPHKNDLDLGKTLVFEFVEEKLPEKAGLVGNFFQHRGAYSNFKSLLETEGLLQAWFDFENSKTQKALRQWCEDNGIELED